MKIAVVQHELRAHVRMDLAALLSLAEAAADEGAAVIVTPCVPGLETNDHLVSAFSSNVGAHAPGATVLCPCIRACDPAPPEPMVTPLGSTLVLVRDECIDADAYRLLGDASIDALVWQFESESELQAEALLEYALDVSLVHTPLVLVASTVGSSRGISRYGGSAIVRLGEIVAEAEGGEDLVVADIEVGVDVPEGSPERPDPSPILLQRLAVHRGEKPTVEWPSDTT
jgi:hypothetical protein